MYPGTETASRMLGFNNRRLTTKGLGRRPTEMIVRAYIRQGSMQSPENKIVNQPAVAEPNLMLGWVNVDIHRSRIYLQVQHNAG